MMNTMNPSLVLAPSCITKYKRSAPGKARFSHLDVEDIEIVDVLNVVLGRELGHVCRVEDAPEKHLLV